MKENLLKSLMISLCTVILFGFAYPLLIWGIGLLTPNLSTGKPIVINGTTIGFENIGQSFTEDRYFNSRPSAVDYDASSTGGSNKGPTNPEYLDEVKARIDTFLVHNPDIKREEIPSELVTASGSGLDPHISPGAALIQVSRISKVRNIPEIELENLVNQSIEKPILGIFGIERINVLKLNLALDNYSK